LSGNAQMWARLMREWQEDTVVLGSQVQRNVNGRGNRTPVAGRGVSFSADTMLSVNVQAHLKNGLVLEIETVKSRFRATGEKCLLSVVRDVGGRWVEE
jgi:hypothetical protein